MSFPYRQNIQTMIIVIGVSGCGKSTKYEKFVQDFPEYKIVERDKIRAMLFSPEKMWQGDEDLVTKIQEKAIEIILESGYNVVVSDTNLSRRTLNNLRRIADLHNVPFRIDDTLVGTPIDVCIERDAKRQYSVGEGVIRRQYEKLQKLLATNYKKELENIR